jgi:putative membrane protein
MADDRRWPGWVYDGGSEPDVRFTFANERTFLAWTRTALAFLAAGVALDSLNLPLSQPVQRVLAEVALTLGLLCALAAWWRWARAERAMRRGEPLPASSTTTLVAIGTTVFALVLLLAGL